MINRYALRCLVGVLCLVTGSVLAQKKQTPARNLTPYESFAFRNRTITPDPIICYGLRQNAFTSIGPPGDFAKARRAPTAQFIVDYVGYPDDAKAAFQRAVDIWSTLIISPVPIRIKATWQPLAATPGFVTLGSARPATYAGAPDGSQQLTYYPVALAEKIARRALNHPDSADIVANFNSDNNWYLGLDARPPARRTDLVSVVLHELGHGLGFTGVIRGDATTKQAGIPFPAIFDEFVVNGSGQLITSPTSVTSATDLYKQLTSDNLFLNGPIVRQKTGDRPKLEAPKTYTSGSTLYHLNEAKYGKGDPNSLMTPTISDAEAIHNPGPIVLSFFEDMEWKTTSILHDPAPDLESPRDVPLVAQIISDTTLGNKPLVLFYKQSKPGVSGTFKQITMTRQGDTQTFKATIPAADITTDVSYFIQGQNGLGKAYTSPGKIDSTQAFHTILTKPDLVAPRIRYTQAYKSVLLAVADTLPILVRVTDDRPLAGGRKRGVDTVYVEYQLNGVARPSVPLLLRNNSELTDSLRKGFVSFPPNTLKAGDRISYRIVARDLSVAANKGFSPATGFYEIVVSAPKATPISRYATDFSTTPIGDFVGDNFSITTPAGFNNPSLNSDHPYLNGADFLTNQSNFTYTLLAPIKVKPNPDSAKIRFDEIVLVEPGAAGAAFGTEDFFDYVIVEGSKDNGRTWFPLIDGYDSNSNSAWLAAWNSSQSTSDPNTGEQNSLAVGTPALLKSRSIGIQDKGYFRGDDIILMRFRLFADQLAHGWGWQVDNLQIQVPPPPPILATEPVPTTAFSVYPNPVSGTMRVMAELSQPTTEATLTLTSPTGQALRQVAVPVTGRKVAEQFDVSQLPAGLYFLQLTADGVKQTKKVMVVK